MNAELARIDKFGRITIPATMREAAQLNAGTEVVLRLDSDGRILLEDRLAGLRRAQERCRSLNGEGGSIVESFLRERREEAIREGLADDVSA
ncbi:MAG: AbrB/MazE/SpoVT family DNA-binding domain-containing protein [Acidobacteria bacterium]|nr:AbrB/MazE/SpoVT family DNA-binding domain-containing protein [Acidobacteriota bacterium]